MLVIDRFDKLETAAAEITRAGNCSVFCYRDIAVPDYGNLEIYPKGVSKAATAQLIIDRINPWEVVAFGDNLNDLPSLTWQTADMHRPMPPKKSKDKRRLSFPTTTTTE